MRLDCWKSSQTWILFLLLHSTEADVSAEETDQDHVALAECALHVTRRYIGTRSNTLAIQEMCNSRSRQNFNNRLIDHYTRHFDEHLSLQLFSGKRDEPLIFSNYNIFVVDNAFAFRDLGLHIPDDTTYERELYFIIVLTHEIRDGTLRWHHMREIFKTCAVLRIPYVLIVQQEPENHNNIGFYTFSMADSYCGNYIKVEMVNRYRNGSLEHDYLFPRRPYDFQGCTINVTARTLDPLLKFDGDRVDPQDLTEITHLSGVEGYLLRILATSLNFKTRLHFPRECSDLHDNENSTGCFSMLDDGSADIAIGGFQGSLAYRLKYSVSLPYYQSSYVFVLRSGLLFGPLQQLASPFCPSVWQILGLIILLAVAFFKCLDFYDAYDARLRSFVLGPHNNHPNSNLLAILLGNPIERPPRRNFARFLFMCWLLATLILRNAYQGKMFDTMRVSRRLLTPRTISELIAHDYKLLSSSFSQFYPQNMTIIMANLTQRYKTIELSADRLATISILDTLSYYNWQNSKTSRMTFVEQPLYMLQLTMYFQKHSLLKLVFNEKLQQLMASGITSYLANEYAPPQFLAMNRRARLLPRISNGMLMGLYRLHAALLGVASICFALEVLSRKYEILQRFFAWLHRKDWADEPRDPNFKDEGVKRAQSSNSSCQGPPTKIGNNN